VDFKGRKWLRQRTVEYARDQPVGEEEPWMRNAHNGPSSLADLSDVELAQALRPMSVYQGYEYILESLDYELVARIRAMGNRTRSRPVA
jgi:hypothetical protein